MLDHEVEECFKEAFCVTKKAGELIRAAFSLEKRIETKASDADLVTETDQEVEKLIIGTLKEKFPTHSFIGEESVAAGEKCELTDNPTWCIDPIDGTTNFVHRFPFVAVSIALIVNKETEVGIVYNVIQNKMYTAKKGKGAFCNDTRIHVNPVNELSKAVVLAEFGSSRDSSVMDSKFRSMRAIINKAHGIRSCGSAALSMSLVAAGNADSYTEFGIHCWDIAAGVVILREAGGTVLSAAGGPLDLMARNVLCASTESLALEISKTIEQLDMGRD